MTATLIRSSLMLCVSLALVGWQAGWRGAKPASASLGEGIIILFMLLVANVAAVVMASTLLSPLLAMLPRGEWSAVPGEVVIRSASAISGLWTASILLQCAQNIGRRCYGLPLEPIEWVNPPKNRRRKERQQNPGAE
jgi:hypothetical protein